VSRIIFRCNGSSKIGYGHFIRSLALAGKISNKHEVIFCCADPGEFIHQQLKERFKLIELPAQDDSLPSSNDQAELAFDLSAIAKRGDLIVLDGYRFGTEYRRAAKSTGARVLCIDDLPFGSYPVDAILNGDPSAKASDYIATEHTQFFLGLKYVLLREEFFAAPTVQKREGVLVLMGGADPYQLSLVYTEQLLKGTPMNVHVVITASANEQMVSSLRTLQSSGRVKIHEGLNAAQMVQLMDSVEFAIVPSSGVLMECIKRKIKPVFGYYADNQLRYYKFFEQKKIGCAIGDMRKKESGISCLFSVHAFNESAIAALSEELGSADFKNLFDGILDQ
jgi:UDP-2,4-diacetamido-2,4,6-trideoxy-beta-L-altropyranose hydrolase